MALAAAACLALGYWQWGRYVSMAGTYQNLGYALQWPLFAAFCVYGYRRFVTLEDEHGKQRERTGHAADTAVRDADDAPEGAAPLGAGSAGAASADTAEPAGVPDPHSAGSIRAAAPSGRFAAAIDRVLGRDRPSGSQVTEIPEGLLPRPAAAPAGRPAAETPEDRALDEYNDYLARLDEHATKGRGR